MDNFYWKIDCLDIGTFIALFYIVLVFSSKWPMKEVATIKKCYIKKVFLKISQNSQENTSARVSWSVPEPKAYNFIKKETLVQVFSSELCEIFKNTFLIEHLRGDCFFMNIIHVVKGKIFQ